MGNFLRTIGVRGCAVASIAMAAGAIAPLTSGANAAVAAPVSAQSTATPLMLSWSAAPSISLAPQQGDAPAGGRVLPAGTGQFMFSGWDGPPLRVFYFMPDKVTEKTRVLFVIHGMGRNADGYRNAWVKHARAGNYILITPEYSLEKFPNTRTFNNGHLFEQSGALRPQEKWTYSSIEPLFDTVRRVTGTKVEKYAIFGHSAGAQFVHRMVHLIPNARYSRAVAANAGVYSFPDLSIGYPYGFKGTPVDEQALKVALQKPLTILLGTADNDPNHHQLTKTPEAEAQGPHRLARGKAFHAYGKTVASKLGVPYAWKISYAPDVAHSNTKVSEYAQRLVWK